MAFLHWLLRRRDHASVIELACRRRRCHLLIAGQPEIRDWLHLCPPTRLTPRNYLGGFGVLRGYEVAAETITQSTSFPRPLFKVFDGREGFPFVPWDKINLGILLKKSLVSESKYRRQRPAVALSAKEPREPTLPFQSPRRLAGLTPCRDPRRGT